MHTAFGIQKYVKNTKTSQSEENDSNEVRIFNQNFNNSTVESRSKSIRAHIEYYQLNKARSSERSRETSLDWLRVRWNRLKVCFKPR